MARTKQTARKSTGSKASRKQPPKMSSASLAAALAFASTTTTSPTETTTTTTISNKMSSSHKKRDLLVQQQQQMRATSLEQELEWKRQRQYIKDHPTPESIAAENRRIEEAQTSVYELLHKNPMDYTGEQHLMKEFIFQPLLKSNEEYIKLYNSNGINLEKKVEELQKQRTQARRMMDLENNNSNDEAARGAVIENTKAYVAAIVATIESNDEESWTMFQDEKKCSSMPTITQQEQEQAQAQAQAQEDNNSISNNNDTKILKATESILSLLAVSDLTPDEKVQVIRNATGSSLFVASNNNNNNNNNVFNKLLTYYNNNGGR